MRLASHLGKPPANQHLAIRLNRDAVDDVVRPSTGIEGGIQRAIGVEPGNTVARNAIHLGEFPADQHLAIGLQGQLPRHAIGACPWIEGGIQRAIGVEPGNAVARNAIHLGKRPPDQHLAIGLQGQVPRRAIGACSWIEGGIQRAISVEPGNAVARNAPPPR